MLFFITYLLPVVASIPTEFQKIDKSGYKTDIDNGTLRNIQFLGDPSLKLNLSNLTDLRAVERNAFNNILDVESLLLANNSLTSLPDFVFSNLTKLRNLSLANNEISSVRNLFVGLENLQLVDISCNPIRHLARGDLFGLTRSVRILVDGNIFWSISTDTFTNSFLKDTEVLKQLAAAQDQEFSVQKNIDDVELDEQENTVSIRNDTRVKICKSDGVVTSLEIFQKDEELAGGCVQVPIDTDAKRVSLREQGIRSFQEGWYRLQSLPIVSLDLSNNEIAEITRETLNDLPAYLTYVNFLGNKIRRIWSQVIENDHLRRLNFKDNLIEEIEEGALGRTKLRGLFLAGNQLENLNFVASLPDTLTEFFASGNRVSSIADGAFSRLSRLLYLNLDDNRIDALPSDAFRGLESLQALTLTGNSITTIEPGAFRDLTALKTLNLHRNSIRDLRRSTFSELTALKELNLAYNKIIKAAFAELPRSVDSLHLDYNDIDVLEEGDFVQAPRFTLSLTGNKIASVKRGAFDLPTLRDLYLNKNALRTIEGDSYEGLGRLRRLWLSENGISEIHKGACKNLGSLYILDISKNPFRKLENGALHGLNTGFGTSLYIYENNLKEMQGGIFDDV
ncbi:carboxypeptidase N subunit 2-like [Linepithema humile]|uniref:carboxypeptidase N subunit 2-like n=1 Tax=Linepithema humile TaxID=83485 RepID=UPI00351E1E4C